MADILPADACNAKNLVKNLSKTLQHTCYLCYCRYDQAGKLVAESALPNMRPAHLAIKGGQASGGARRGDIVTIALVPAGERMLKV